MCGRLHHIVAQQGTYGYKAKPGYIKLFGKSRIFTFNLLKPLFTIIHQIHFINADNKMGNLQQFGNKGVPAGLLGHSIAGINKYNGRISRRCAGDHIAGILNMSRSVGDDEFALRGGKIAVGHINGNSLLSFGPEAIGE